MDGVVREVNVRISCRCLSLVNADNRDEAESATVCRLYCLSGEFIGEIVSAIGIV